MVVAGDRPRGFAGISTVYPLGSPVLNLISYVVLRLCCICLLRWSVFDIESGLCNVSTRSHSLKGFYEYFRLMARSNVSSLLGRSVAVDRRVSVYSFIWWLGPTSPRCTVLSGHGNFITLQDIYTVVCNKYETRCCCLPV